MSIESTNNRNDYIGNGSVLEYDYTFKIQNEAHLRVTKRAVDGTETLLVLNDDYTVTGVGLSGGTIVLPVGNELPMGVHLTIRRVEPLTQEVDIRNRGDFYPEVHEDAFDHFIAVAQQQQDELGRSLKLPETVSPETFNNSLPAGMAGTANSVLMTNATGDGWKMGPTATDISSAQTNAAAAFSSQVAAASSQAAAANSAAVASAAMTAAQTAAQSNLWADVVFKDYSNSPITITASDRGKLYVIDSTGGNVIINLPVVASLNLGTPFAIGVKKDSNDGNVVLITRSSTDTIDGSTTKTILTPASGCTLVPDVDPTPDRWTAVDFGAIAGNMIVDSFTGNGSTTAYTLSTAPGSINNTWVYVGGLMQRKSTYTVVGTALTFSAAPPNGVPIECVSGMTSFSTPGDLSVSTTKIVDSSVTTAKINDLAVTTAKINDLAITTAKLAASSVTKAKLGSDVVFNFNKQVFTSSGTFTVPTGVTEIFVTACGGGGGGAGGGYTSSSQGWGGGGGASSILRTRSLTVTPGASVTVTIGAAGGGGGFHGNGGSGGTTTVGSLQFMGGYGGSRFGFTDGSTFIRNGGQGGPFSAAGGDGGFYGASGTSGEPAEYAAGNLTSTPNGTGGSGGGGSFGPGGNSGPVNAAATAVTSTYYGSGGGGSPCNDGYGTGNAGGAGAGGYAMITWIGA